MRDPQSNKWINRTFLTLPQRPLYPICSCWLWPVLCIVGKNRNVLGVGKLQLVWELKRSFTHITGDSGTEMRIRTILFYFILPSGFLFHSCVQHPYSFRVRNLPELVFYPHSLLPFSKVLYHFNSVLTVLPSRKKHCLKHTTHLSPIFFFYSLDLCHLPTGIWDKDWRAESPQATFVTCGGPSTIQPT